MSFATGTVTYRRFAVTGGLHPIIDATILDKLSDDVLRPSEFGVPEEIQYGWSGGHILDTQFTFERNVFDDALCFALRIDTNRVPGDLKRAYIKQEEDALAALNPSGFISTKTLTTSVLLTSLRSTVCPACGRSKKPMQSLCRSDYSALPRPLRNALYGLIADGAYHPAMIDALKFLKVKVFNMPEAQ